MKKKDGLGLKRLNKKSLRRIVRDYENVFRDSELRETAWENTAIEFAHLFVREKFKTEYNRLEEINKAKNWI